MSWQQGTVEIQTIAGPRNVAAVVRGNLAVHESIDDAGRYTVTHIPTGMCLPGLSAPTLDGAIRVADAIELAVPAVVAATTLQGARDAARATSRDYLDCVIAGAEFLD